MATDPIQEFVKKYSLVIDKSKSNDKVLYIRSIISTVDEAELFYKKFSQKTNTKWRLHYGNYNPQKVIFHKHWVCHRSDYKYKCFHKSVSCSAKMDVLVKKVNLSTCRNDTFLCRKPPLPCIIRMHVNHSYKCKESRKYCLIVPDEVKELFYGYFDNGIGVTQAMRMNEESVKLNEVNHRVTRSSRLVPTKRQIYYIYDTWRRQKRISSVVCDDEDAFVTFDVDDLINAIPQEDPPERIQKHAQVLPSTSDSAKQNPPTVNKSVKPALNVAVTKPQFISQIKEPISSSSVLPKIFLLKGPIQKQHIAVNSPSHLNGSILTVVNSRSVIPLIPTLANTQVSSVLTPQISSVVSLPKAANSLFVSDKENSSESSSKSSTQYRVSSPHQLSVKDLSQSLTSENKPAMPNLLELEISTNLKSKTEKELEYLQLDSSSNSKSCVSSYSSSSAASHHVVIKEETLSSVRTDENDSSNQICSPVSQDSRTSSHISSISNSVNSSHEIDLLKSFTESNPITYLTRKGKSLSKCASPSSVTTDECTKANSSSVTATQIQITNTVHQSGAQISMKSTPVNHTEVPIMSNVHDPVSQNGCQSSINGELPVVKIKEEPLDESEYSEFMESGNSCLIPTITNVSSLNSENISSNEAVAMSHIKVESSDNETMGDHLSILSEDILPSPSIGSIVQSPSVVSVNDNAVIASCDSSVSVNAIEEDEDHKFLMSLLPELRRIPKDLKVRLKIEMQNLLLTTRLSVNRKRRVAEINNIYHDCRILPSFPVLK